MDGQEDEGGHLGSSVPERLVAPSLDSSNPGRALVKSRDLCHRALDLGAYCRSSAAALIIWWRPVKGLCCMDISSRSPESAQAEGNAALLSTALIHCL